MALATIMKVITNQLRGKKMAKLTTEEKIKLIDQLKRSMAPSNEWDQDYPYDQELKRKAEQFIEELKNEKKLYEVIFYYNEPDQGYDMLEVDRILVWASSKKSAIRAASLKTWETHTDVKADIANILEAD